MAQRPDAPHLGSSTRKLLTVQQPAPQQQQSNALKTCCTCKCVNPAKDMRSPECKATPGCVGMAAPTYSQKNICVDGGSRKCDDVCVRNMGSWTALYEC